MKKTGLVRIIYCCLILAIASIIFESCDEGKPAPAVIAPPAPDPMPPEVEPASSERQEASGNPQPMKPTKATTSTATTTLFI